MHPRGEQPRNRGAFAKSSSLQEKIATFYYTLGLICSTYPVYVLLLVALIVVGCWFPLANLPFPGNNPQIVWTSNVNTSTSTVTPFCYVQQVVYRGAVLPWENDSTLADAFRAPLYEAFKLLEVVRNFQDEQNSKTLGHICLHVESIKRSKQNYRNVLPQYSCLVLSPTNFWHQDVQIFAQDNSILNTIFSQHSFQKGKVSVAEMLFGMHLLDTGIKRYPLRNRQRVIQYAITLFLKDYDLEFINGLREKLASVYPLHQNQTLDKQNSVSNDTALITYPDELNYFELVPLFVSFVLLFFYYYFSVRKIEMIKSKVGMAFTVIVTVFCSLTMTMGICFFFGLTLSLQSGKNIFPFLAILVGLENVLVLTKSVVSTPLHLDVKIRNAQGLSKEGWSITKNLFLEITILTFGLFTFVPAIQEFCIFAIVGLITDFFLQITFFSTVLGIDITRSENSAEKTTQNFRNNLYQTQSYYEKHSFRETKSISRSKSHPRLSTFPANIVAGGQVQEKKIPKRLRLVNMWARTRFFQRSFMILMVIWICVILYNSDILNNFIPNYVLNERNLERNDKIQMAAQQNYSKINLFPLLNKTIQMNYVTYSPLGEIKYAENQTMDIDKLKHSDYAPWLKLSLRHWSAILRKYNISLGGQTVAILPNIKLSHIIRPEQAALLRNPEEKYGEKFQWQALAAALDPIDFRDVESSGSGIPQSEQPFYPSSPMEIMLTTILCLISIIVLAYIFVVLYRCICSRNYAEWRASWYSEKVDESSDDQVLLEAVPVVLEGHQQEIECIASDGVSVVSACLSGQLKVWDNTTGELLANIDRKSYFSIEELNKVGLDEDNVSDYESGSPPSRDDCFPKLLHPIKTDFSHIYEQNDDSVSAVNDKYDFTKIYNHLYHDFVPNTKQYNGNVDVKTMKRFSDYSLQQKQHIADMPKFYNEDNSCNSISSSLKSEHNFNNVQNGSINNLYNAKSNKLSPIWCIDYLDNLIVIGCADGRLEFWEGTTGRLKCVFEDGSESGVSHLKMIGSKVIAARLCGTLDFFQLQTYNQGRPIEWNFTSAYRRTHLRTGSAGSISDFKQTDYEEDLQCIKTLSVKAHQQPITCLDCEGGRVLSGSQDHLLKVYRLDDGSPVYTLHGHCGPITCLFIDRINPATSGSGSQEGMLCVWDLLTGACMYNIQAHDGSITSLTYSASYVISLGTDERLCVWERFQGHLLNTISIPNSFSSQILMLASHLVVTARSGGLVIWDVRSGDCVRTITLGRTPFVFIKQLILLRDAVLCDYGKQLRIVSFPLITHKFD